MSSKVIKLAAQPNGTVTAQQLADMVNDMPRKDRQSLAEDLESTASRLLRFAELVRK